MPSLSRLSKYLASFFKRSWNLEDYPLVLRQQESLNEGQPVPPWVATIDGWHLTGLGETSDTAIQDLRSRFEAYRAENTLPRPGTKVPLQFAGASELDRHGEFAYEFIEHHVGVRPFFMSDGTTLADFDGVTPMEDVHASIRDRYGVESEPFETEPLWMLLDSVKSARGSEI